MSKRKSNRPAPLSEGVLWKIYKHFIAPLVIYKPIDVAIKEWEEDFIWQSRFREILQYRARQPFKMPGLFYVAAQVKFQGLGYRLIKQNQLILVRKDSREDYWDIEFFGGQGDKSQVFQLNESEWNSIAALLEEIPARGMRGKGLTKDMDTYIRKLRRSIAAT